MNDSVGTISERQNYRFTGITVSKVEFLNGCIQFCVKPTIKEEGKMPEGEYIDQNYLEVVGNGVYINPKGTGGDMADMSSDQYRG